jgi:hypothetical protein
VVVVVAVAGPAVAAAVLALEEAWVWRVKEARVVEGAQSRLVLRP